MKRDDLTIGQAVTVIESGWRRTEAQRYAGRVVSIGRKYAEVEYDRGSDGRVWLHHTLKFNIESGVEYWPSHRGGTPTTRFLTLEQDAIEQRRSAALDRIKAAKVRITNDIGNRAPTLPVETWEAIADLLEGVPS